MSEYYELYQQCKLERDLLREEIQKRDAETERLKKFCSEFVYGEENPEYYSTMDEKIQKRDELLERVKPWLEMYISELKYPEVFKSHINNVNQWLKQYEEMKR